MIYQPKILYNPTSETVEFMCDRKVYVFKPSEKKHLDGFVAYHALKEVNTGLKEYEGEVSDGSIAYEQMPWKELIALGSKLNVFTPGISKKELIQRLIDAEEN